MSRTSTSAGVIYAARGKAIDEQNDITPANKFIDQFSLCRVGHAGTAMQSDDRGKRACALGLGQIPLDALARNDGTPKDGACKLYALQRTANASTTKARAAHHSVSTTAVSESDSSRHAQPPVQAPS